MSGDRREERAECWGETGIDREEEPSVDYMMGLWKSGRRTRERIKGRMDGWWDRVHG